MWASSWNGCLLLQHLCYREKIKILTTYEDYFQDGYALTVVSGHVFPNPDFMYFTHSLYLSN